MESSNFIEIAQQSITKIFDEILLNYEDSINYKYFYLTDPTKTHYMLFSNGTGVDEGYTHDLLIHLKINEAEIVILKNETDFELETDFEKAGIEETEIVIPHTTQQSIFV